MAVPAAGAPRRQRPRAGGRHGGGTGADTVWTSDGDCASGGTAGGITHDSQTEGYYIVSGGGTMFTDGYIVTDATICHRIRTDRPAAGMAYDVVKKNGEARGHHHYSRGLVHGWLDIPEHVDYLSFRPSPGILTAGWVHPVLRSSAIRTSASNGADVASQGAGSLTASAREHPDDVSPFCRASPATPPPFLIDSTQPGTDIRFQSRGPMIGSHHRQVSRPRPLGRGGMGTVYRAVDETLRPRSRDQSPQLRV